MDVVGVVLGAVALLDPAYHGLRSLLRAYQTAQDFGQDFEISMTGLNSQEWIFASHLQSYETQYNLRGREAIHGGHQKLLKQIAAQITAIVKVLNQCYEIVRKYDNECDEADVRSAAAAGPGAAQQNSARQPNPFVAQARSKLHKFPDRLRVKNGVMKYLEREAERKQAKDANERLTLQGSAATQPVGYFQESLMFNPKAQKGLSGSSAETTLAAHRQRVDKRMKEAQKRADIFQLVSWADHGKRDFDAQVLQLKGMNEALRDILPIAVRLDDPFRKIRSSAERPKLWEKTESIRTELDGFHIAIRGINVPFPAKALLPIKFAVKLEENFEEIRAMAEAAGILNELALRSEPILFSLMPRSEHAGPPRREFILSTTVCRGSQHEIENLPKRMADLAREGADSNEIGSVTHGLQDRRIYHLQMIEAEDLVGGHFVSDLVGDARLREKERICLAGQIAQSHVQFMAINQGKARGPLSNYQLFGQEPPTDPAANWAPELLSSLWAEFGFGASAGQKSMVLKARAKFQEERINAAVELGVLIYQVSAGKTLQYEPTVPGLQKAREDARASLKDAETLCGLYMREIVETCFMAQQGGIEEQREIVQEVAAALGYYAARLKNAT